MNPLDNPASAEGILNIAIHVTAVLILGWLFMHLVRKRGAPLLSGVCLASLLIVLVVPFLSFGLIDWGQPHYGIALHVLPETGTPHIISQLGAPAVPDDLLARNDQLPNPQSGNPWAALLGSGPTAVSLTNLFGLIWGLMSLLLLVRLVYGAYTVNQYTRDAKPVSGADIRNLLTAAAAFFGSAARARIYESPHVGGPMVVGLIRPKILIPPDFMMGLRDGELRSILLHELSHIRHRDHISAVIQRIATALTWWNPLSHILSRAFSRAREEISDNHVLLENNSHDYAECLINLAERSTRLRRLPVGLAMASPHIPLADRVKNILSKERTMETQLKKSSLLLIALLSVLLLGGLTGYRLSFAESNPAESPPTLKQAHPIQDQEGGLKQPKLIKKVDPIYPKEASQQGIQGTVAVEAKISTEGTITDARVIHSAHDLLDKAALEAVQKWHYQPMEKAGKPVPAFMTVIFRFRMEDNRPEVAILTDDTGTDEKRPPLRAKGDIMPPEIIKLVEPEYPEEAREAGIQGVVILEATTDVYGRVKDVKILRSIPALNEAAKAAVEQWIYEPKIVDGEPRAITFTVTVRFKDDEKTDAVGISGGGAGGVVGGVEGGIQPPKLIKMVEPVYPKEAEEAGIEGVVILELKVDEYGRVKDVRILRSIPELDQAAVDAVKQWIYEPPTADGKPLEDVLTVTVRFKKDEETDVIK